jgi:hypothetical protein
MQLIPAMHSIPVNPIGFVAGTPILTAKGYKPIEDIKPGDMIQVQPNDDQGDDKHEAQDTDEPGWWESN